MATLIPEEESLFPVNKSAAKDRFLYSGPLLHFNNFETPSWYNKAKELDGDFIYLSMGSSSLKLYPQLLDRLVQIYGNMPNVYVITNTTFIISAKEKSTELPPNFFITNMAPADQMLALADLTICHGGKGTIYHSILNDVPVLGVPHQAEQEMNLVRIRDLKLGDFILGKNLSKISNTELKRKIDEVLNDKLIRKSVHKTAAAIRESMNNLDTIVRSIHTTINQK
jgi:UDP:flavonoid glycosyltransferase YjiC (YdhE family)